jgi:uncharacterized membrane protein YcaP (DUF421 family)
MVCYLLQATGEFDWQQLLLGEEKWPFLLETVFRTLIMFLVILLSLRMLGKRGIKQLSVFELGVIIGLGSAAGDPMFYKDVGLLPALIVFLMVVLLYRLITYFINQSSRFERFVEGQPRCIVEKGRLLVENFKKEPLALDELFSELRLKSVSHLGQIDQAIIETNGEVSIFFYPDDKVQYGLPIIPDLYNTKLVQIENEGAYACHSCGNIEHLKPITNKQCTECQQVEWVAAIDHKRIS